MALVNVLELWSRSLRLWGLKPRPHSYPTNLPPAAATRPKDLAEGCQDAALTSLPLYYS